MNIIFYYPDNITSDPKKGSEVRPYSMLTTFLDLGYKVDVVKEIGRASCRERV